MDNETIDILIQLELEKPAIRITDVVSNLQDFDMLLECLLNVYDADLKENHNDNIIFPNGNYSVIISIKPDGIYFDSPFNVNNTQAICKLASAYLVLCEEPEGLPS